MLASKLPQPGDSVPSVYVYALQLDVSVLGLGLVDIVNPVASARQVSFGTDTSGNETIGGSGMLAVAGHGGNMLVVGSPGSSTIAIGNGASLIFAETGNMTLTGGSGSMQVVVGIGNATITEGSGPTSYDVVSGAAGGVDIVPGFKLGTDTINLFGYQPSQISILSGGGNSIVQLSDGTKIELLGVPHPNTSIIT